MDIQQVLTSPLWQTIAALVSIITGLALIILFFRNPQRSRKEKQWITTMVTFVSLVVLALSAWGIGAFSAQTSTSCSSSKFAQGVMHASSTTILFWFEPCGWKASEVIVHYTINGGNPQNPRMTLNTSRWEYTIDALDVGQHLTYFYTYQNMGIQDDTRRFDWTDDS